MVSWNAGRKAGWRPFLCSLVLAGLAVGTALPAQACYGGAAMGMGGAYTSLAEGVLAVYWNQAGLAFTEGRGEVSTTVSIPRDWINYNGFHGAAVKINDRIGIGYGRTEVFDDWTSVTRRSTWDTLAAGVKLTESLAVGAAYRQTSGRVLEDGTSFHSTALDLSAQYRNGPVRLGLLLQDFNEPTESGAFPVTWMRNIRPSVAVELEKLTVAIDIYNAEELKTALQGTYGDYVHQAGLEYRPFGKEGPLALRAGFYHEWVLADVYDNLLTLGAGFKTEGLVLDVAWIPEWGVTQVTAGVRF